MTILLIESSNGKTVCRANGNISVLVGTIVDSMQVSEEIRNIILTAACSYCQENKIPIQDLYNAATKNTKP